MPYCVAPGCAAIVPRGRCRAHTVRRENAVTRRWYYTARWMALRAEVLREALYTCGICGQVQQRLEVDHIRKHHGDPGRFWDKANLQALCPTCHHAKTQRGE
jgi:5-methylcytosine-specific restriction endonuclease McrA